MMPQFANKNRLANCSKAVTAANLDRLKAIPPGRNYDLLNPAWLALKAHLVDEHRSPGASPVATPSATNTPR